MSNLAWGQRELVEIERNLLYYRQAVVQSYCPWEQQVYEWLYHQEVNRLLSFCHRQCSGSGHAPARQEQVFTPEELSRYDGADGRKAYVAVNGIVYDLSREASWGGGTHFGLFAGQVLTQEFASCHNAPVILEQLPVVGVLTT